MNSLDGMVAFVTGASSGIGEGIAVMLAEEGARVALVGRRQGELERVAGIIRGQGGEALVLAADLRDDAGLRSAIEQAQEQLGPVDILVNSGGVIYVSPVHEIKMETWDESMAVNLRAPALLCSALLPGMRERKRGYIINIASEAGMYVYGGMGSYVVSKHALRVLTELIQDENQSLGIKAWAICPGMVDTPLADWAPSADRHKFLSVAEVVSVARFLLKQGTNVKLGPAILLGTMANPFE